MKRRIDFSENQVKEQSNNNSNVVKASNEVVANRTRSKSRTVGEQVLDGQKGHSSRVPWTKEFIDKVCKSNKKYEKKLTKKSEAVKPNKKDIENSKVKNNDVLLQNNNTTKGDGVRTEVEVEEESIEEELLDYDDDLSMDKEEVDFTQENSSDDNGMGKGLSAPCEHVQSDSSNNKQQQPQPSTLNWLANLSSQREEEIMKNPILQRMMKNFFEENFKSLNESKKQDKTKQV